MHIGKFAFVAALASAAAASGSVRPGLVSGNRLRTLAALGAVGYAAWKYYENARDTSPPAFAASASACSVSTSCKTSTAR